MNLTKEEKDSIFLDTLIHTFRINPQLYDKSEGTYVYTPEKIKLLKDLSVYLKSEFEIVKGVQDIVAAWQKLVSQFKKADEKQASGSAASDNNFEYYENLLFLKPTLKHKTKLTSTMTSCASSSISIPSAAAQPTSTLTNPWPTSNWTSASASSEFLGLYPYSIPYAVPSVGQHPQWVMVPQNFGSPMSTNYPYFPFPSVPSAASSVPTQHMPPMLSTTSVNGLQIPAALPYNNYNIATPPTTQTSALKKDSARTTSTKRVPEYDDFAKKKLKLINDDEQQFKQISNNIIATLDKVNKKLAVSESNSGSSQLNYQSQRNLSSSASVSSPRNVSHSLNLAGYRSPQTSQSVAGDYSNLLSKALSKVPTELQDDLMAYLLDELTEFNKLYKRT